MGSWTGERPSNGPSAASVDLVGPTAGEILGGGPISSPWGGGELVITERGLHLCDPSRAEVVTVAWAEFRRDQIELGPADGPSELTLALDSEAITFTLAPAMAAAVIGASGRYWFQGSQPGESDVELFDAIPQPVAETEAISGPDFNDEVHAEILLGVATTGGAGSTGPGSPSPEDPLVPRGQPAIWLLASAVASCLIVAVSLASVITWNEPGEVALSNDVLPSAPSPGTEIDHRPDHTGAKAAAGAAVAPVGSTTSTVAPAPPSSSTLPPAEKPAVTAPPTTASEPPDGTTAPAPAPPSSTPTSQQTVAQSSTVTTAPRTTAAPAAPSTDIGPVPSDPPSEPSSAPTAETPEASTEPWGAVRPEGGASTDGDDCHRSYRPCSSLIGELRCLIEMLRSRLAHPGDPVGWFDDDTAAEHSVGCERP